MKTLQQARAGAGLTQGQLASRLGVSQAYLSMLEAGRRAPSAALARRLATALRLSPLSLDLEDAPRSGAEATARALAGVGYPGLAHLKRQRALNPAAVLLQALAHPQLEGRLVEALPWLAFRYPDLDWPWLVGRVKQQDLQNRLGYVLHLAWELATRMNRVDTAEKLARVLGPLKRSKLAREDTLSEESMTEAERQWLRQHRPAAAVEWNVLSDLTSEQLAHAD